VPEEGPIYHAFLYTPGTVIQDLGTLPGGSFSQAQGINDSGQVVGWSFLGGTSTTHAFLYTPGTVMQDLGTLGGGYSNGLDINNLGQVTGYSWTGGVTTYEHAFIYSSGTGMVDLNPLLGGYGSRGQGINNSGEVLGNYSIIGTAGSTDTHPFLYTPGTGMQVLGTLGGSPCFGQAINDSGQVAGWSFLSDNTTAHAFLYSGGKMTDLGTLPGGTYSHAQGINNLGQVVGDSDTAGGASHAFLYSNGKMIDLNTLIDPSSGWELEYCAGINDLGQITGNGSINGQYHAFLMTPFLKVTIDIEPWFKPNIIDINLKWLPIPVAILSTPSFNAPKSVDLDSLTFGHSGNEKSLAFCCPLPVDVNCDKAPDLICFFNTGEAGFQCGDTQGILKGQTKNGTPIQGSDSVKIIPCK
jgi:probable HAF family extracellular repeat protein